MSVFHPAFPMRLYPSKAKVIFSILVGLVFSVSGALITYGLYTQPSDNLNGRALLMKVVGPLSVPLFLWLVVIGVRQLLDKRPVLVVDDKGISARSTFNETDMSWKDIAQVFVQERQVSLTTKLYLLILVPRDANAALQKVPQKYRKRKENSLKQYGGFEVFLQQLPGNTRQIAETIAEYGRQQIVANPVTPPMMPPVVSG